MAALTLLRANDPDADLKHLASMSKDRAWSRLVARYRARIVRHALGIVHDEDHAHDIAQDVLMRAMRERRLWDDDFRIGAWLRRVTANLCFNQVRDRRRRGEILAGLQEPKAAPAEAPALVLQHQQNRALVDAMTHVSPDHRAVLEARFWGDHSYDEIAEILDLELGTVMSRLSRAKSALRPHVDPRLLRSA
jgi:RNA polymerase sigma-70 factor (ECF subfamily)